jgi:glycosyltransferase involved in cell wall biosynthesis
MCTYNGQTYIAEQLLSILQQTKQPDEVILYDDASTDSTVAVIRSFLAEHGLEKIHWNLIVGKENRGYPLSFYYAMELCKGDIVFLSDQDDIWDSHKIERMSEQFIQQPLINLVSCKFGLLTINGDQLHTWMNPGKSRETKKSRDIRLADIFGKYQWPGMVLAYRRRWMEDLYSHVFHGNGELLRSVPHDFLLATWAAETETFLQLDETLAYHRRHDKNAAKEEHRVSKLLNRERKLWEIEKYKEMLDAMIQGNVLQTASGRQELKEKHQAMEERYQILYTGKIIKLLRSLWKFRRTVRVETAICDMIIVCKMKVTPKHVTQKHVAPNHSKE